MPKQISLIGQQFGRLFVLRSAGFVTETNGHRRSVSLCRCACGKETIVRNYDLSSGNTASCGCLNRDGSFKPSRTHGCASRNKPSGAYRTWRAMMQRCRLTTGIASKNYRKRGIRVCDRWLMFENFLTDMGERPKGMMLERKDNNGIYEPSNCRWANRTEQNRNKRNNRIVTVRGFTGCVSAACEHFGLSQQMVYMRLHRGVPIELAFNPPSSQNLRQRLHS